MEKTQFFSFEKCLQKHFMFIENTRHTHIFVNIEYDRSYVVVQIYYSNDSNVVNGRHKKILL
jgi:hypothetical protein